jgi:RimJ/RimL family protein N-acetyltransferase
MLDYAFTALGLHSVMLTTDSYNLAGQVAYHSGSSANAANARC